MIADLTRRFTVDGVTLHWDRWGTPSGVPFLLCHGFSGSAHDFALNVESFVSDREVVAIDHRGHGRSEKLGAVDRYSIDRIAADLVAFIDSEIGGPVDLLGHSMGGSIALRVTLARPDLVRSLILMDTSAWAFVPPDTPMAELMGAFVRAYDPANGLPDLSAFENPENALIESATPGDWQAIKAAMDAAFDPYAMKALGTELFTDGTQWIRERLDTISCPVTVVVGEHDHPFVDQAAELAREAGGGPVALIPGAYHSPQLTHAAEWTAAVQGHLARS